MYAVTFRFRAFDGGNRRLQRLAHTILKHARRDDILVLHDLKPAVAGGVDTWLREVKAIITGLEAEGLEIIPLERLIDRPVMESTTWTNIQTIAT